MVHLLTSIRKQVRRIEGEKYQSMLLTLKSFARKSNKN